MDHVRQIAQAVLYERHLPWPPDRHPWAPGGLHPPAGGDAHTGDPWQMQTQCLVEAGPADTVDVHVRFLHVITREVARVRGGELEPVAELTVDGNRHLAGQEAREREEAVSGLELGRLARAPRVMEIDVPADQEAMWLIDAGGPAGAVLRGWEELRGRVEVRAESLHARLFRLTVRVANTTACRGAARAEVWKHTFVSAHSVVHTRGGRFVSLLDPPEKLRPLAEGCRNVGTWPVLVGPEGERHTMLSAPIVLHDHLDVSPRQPA
jgi:hydrogenase maturation protease